MMKFLKYRVIHAGWHILGLRPVLEKVEKDGSMSQLRYYHPLGYCLIHYPGETPTFGCKSQLAGSALSPHGSTLPFIHNRWSA